MVFSVQLVQYVYGGFLESGHLSAVGIRDGGTAGRKFGNGGDFHGYLL